MEISKDAEMEKIHSQIKIYKKRNTLLQKKITRNIELIRKQRILLAKWMLRQLGDQLIYTTLEIYYESPNPPSHFYKVIGNGDLPAFEVRNAQMIATMFQRVDYLFIILIAIADGDVAIHEDMVLCKPTEVEEVLSNVSRYTIG